MLITILLIANIPIYLLIGWILFDTKDNAADSIFGAVISILKVIFIPRIVRVFMDDDDDSGADTFMLAIFLFLCGIIVYGEYYVIDLFFK